MTEMQEQLPIWDEREAPTLQLTDVTGGSGAESRGDLMHVVDGSREEGDEFTAWLNESRGPLYAALGWAASPFRSRLAFRGIRVAEIAACVAAVTETEPYSPYRVHSLQFLQKQPTYNQAVETVTPGLAFDEDSPIDGQFNPLLGVIALNDRFVRYAGEARIAHTIAENLGQAATGPIINIQIEDDPSPAYRYWYGYQWRQGGNLFGGALQKAATEKLAALTRKKLGIVAPDTPADNPIAESYRTSEGYYDESAIAMALDVINQHLGFGPEAPGIYRPLWQFGQAGGNGEARQEAADMIHAATGGSMRLEMFEALPAAHPAFPLEFLQRVESATNMDVSARPSRLFVG